MSRRSRAHRESGQVIVLFALSLFAFLAMVGLVIDGGTLYVQRRTAQNAADAAAMAGTWALKQATQQSTATVGDAICTYVLANAFGVTPSATAFFVGTDGTSNLGTISLSSDCSASPPSWIPAGASGVRVAITIGPYNTYLVGIAGLRQLKAEANATAQVGTLSIPLNALTPLAGCGPDMLTDGQSPNPFRAILNPDNSINPTHYGDDLILQGSQLTQNEVAPQGTGCPSWNGSSSAWKGRVSIDGVTGPLSTPVQLPVDTGNSSIDGTISSTCTTLYGSGADPTAQNASTSRCYLLVPIAAPPNPSNKANIVTVGCFKVYDGGSGAQKWRGILVAITSVTCSYGDSSLSWTFGSPSSPAQVLLTR